MACSVVPKALNLKRLVKPYLCMYFLNISINVSLVLMLNNTLSFYNRFRLKAEDHIQQCF